MQQGIITDVDNKYSYQITKLIIKDIIPNEELNRKYFNTDDLLNYLNDIYAPENKYILYTLFLGIKGDNFEEIVNIKASDVDIENSIVTLLKGRVVKVDKLWINLMEKANNSEYYDKDGTLFSSNSRIDLNYYNQSEYVLKFTKRYDNNPLTSSVIDKRIRTIKKQTKNNYLSAKNIYLNGMINYIKDRYDENGISLKSAFLDKINPVKSVHDVETQQYIRDYGAEKKVIQIRREIIDFLDCFEVENELMDEYLEISNEIKTFPDKYKEIISKARIGQSIFRDRLMERYNGKCAICDIYNEKMLVASHVKSYAECEDGEQVDIDNGLLLCANHDRLFDNHLISFDDKGEIIISHKINKAEYDSLKISKNIKLILYANNNKYLRYHLNKMKCMEDLT